MPGRHRSPAPALSQWRARVALAGAGACAGLIGQAIGLGLLEWPSGGLPGFPWWQPPTASASPAAGHGTQEPGARELPVAEVAWFLPLPQPGAAGTPPNAAVTTSIVAARAAPEPAPRAGVPPVAAEPRAPSMLTATVGDTTHAVVGGVAPVAQGVVGTAGHVVTAATGVVGTVAEVPRHVVATAGAVVDTTTHVVDTATDVVDRTTDVVDTATEVSHRVVDNTAGAVDNTAGAVVDTVEDVVGDVSGKQSGGSDHPVLETVTSAVHLPR